MRRRVRRAGISTVAVAAAVALAGGMTAPAAAQKQTADRSVAGGAGAAAEQRIQLITGDRVVVDGTGKVVRLERAKGREKIPVQIQRLAGHTLVVPLDAQRLIADGALDRRLFDITELSKAETRRAQKKGLKLIVGYKGAAANAKAQVRDAGDTRVRRVLTSLNADAVTTPRDDTAQLWEALTDERGAGGRTTTSGVDKIWLDGVRKASLDRSVKQIGADKGWAAGYDGTGVKIAVLDTGVDVTHADLEDQVVAAKNFSVSAGTDDKFGHGTHVASIAAGTGAKSGGKYKGVAPGAKLLNGKVLSDDGYGDESGILAGIDWAVTEGADVVNLSLGGPDTPVLDVLEAAVNKYSEQNGVLFAIAAGNEGEGGAQTVGSPGSAEAALTVGAVDRSDKLAGFSSRGPRVGDGGLKPDVTAPGVDIAAAAAPGSLIDKDPSVAHPAPGYLAISGTSMATPHVAGAAALLKQQHPDWKYTELKSVLTGSAKGGAYTPFQQGTGRIQVDKAVKQTVFADPSPVQFGVAQWPHTDDPKLTKKLTYKNLGTEDVTLDLAVKGYNPKGQAAPAGFFTLGATKVTVPAGGTAAVDVSADTKLGGTVHGAYSAYVTASGGGQSVRTAAAVQREVESYDLTVKHIGRDGQPAPDYATDLIAYSGQDFPLHDESGTVKVRLPKGTYLLDSKIAKDPVALKGGVDWLVNPRVSLTRNVSLTLDARTAKARNITVPDAAAKPLHAASTYSYQGAGWFNGLDAPSFGDLRTAHLGPEVTGLTQDWSGTWTKGAATEYNIVLGGAVKKFGAGGSKHFKANELAKVSVALGASAGGKTAGIVSSAYLPGEISSYPPPLPVQQKAPGKRTLHLSTTGKAAWTMDVYQFGGEVDEEGFPVPEAGYELGRPQTFTGGKSYAKVFNTGVFGPKLNADFGVFRTGNELYAGLPVFADGMNHTGWPKYASGRTQLFRNGTKIGENPGAPDGGIFTLPAGEATYKLVSSVRRDLKVATATSRVNVTFTFKSKKVANETRLPVSVARFTPKLALDSTAPAGKKVSMPVTVQGAAAGKNLKSLTVYVSYDGGKNWKKLTLKKGKVEFKNPAKGKSVSFHAKISDKKGNTTAMSVYDAYYGK